MVDSDLDQSNSQIFRIWEDANKQRLILQGRALRVLERGERERDRQSESTGVSDKSTFCIMA